MSILQHNVGLVLIRISAWRVSKRSVDVASLTGKQVLMLVILVGGASLAILNQTAISPMLPSIMDEMSVSSATAQWLVSGYTIVMALLVPISAFLMNRCSTRQIFFASMALFFIGSIMCAFAPQFIILLVGRCLQGACAGIMMPLATSVMLLVFPLEKRGTAMGIYSLITMLMPAIGPAATGFLTDLAGWQVVYFGMAAITAVFALIAIPALSNYGSTENAKLDIPSLILSSLGLLALLYGISEFGNQGLTLINAISIVVGIVLVVVFARRQLKIPDPLLNLKVFAYFRFTVGLCILMGIQLVVNANAVIMPLLIQQGMGGSASETGLVTLPGALIGAFAALGAGKLFDRFGPRIVSTVGAIIVCAGYAGLAFIDGQTSLILLAALTVLTTAGMLCITTPINTWSLGFLPDDLIPHGNAVSNTMRQVASAIGTAILVSLMAIVSQSHAGEGVAASTISGASAIYLIVAACVLIIAICIFLFVKRDDSQIQNTGIGFPNAEGLVAVDSLVIPNGTTVRKALFMFNDAGTTDAPIIDRDGSIVAFLSVGDVLKQLGSDKVKASLVDFYSYVPELLSGDGIVTERGRLEDILEKDASSIATKKVITIEARASFKDVCQLLSERRIKKVPVMKEGVFIGTINRKDIVNHLMVTLAE